mmetsp:Transcript_21495/g.73619  ORF Transcript_21495/g.73619 Transcript_21495/m.73619 type:complete len:85 (-) Transcript_21495:72-326(-)
MPETELICRRELLKFRFLLNTAIMASRHVVERMPRCARRRNAATLPLRRLQPPAAHMDAFGQLHGHDRMHGVGGFGPGFGGVIR